MITIQVTNNVCTLSGHRKQTLRMFKEFQVRNPNAFHLRKYMPPGWDGKKPFITNGGKFDTGMLERVYAKARELGFGVKMIDRRVGMPEPKLESKRLKKLTLRDYQFDSVKAVVLNKLKKLPMPRGTVKVATNGGKTYISAGVYLAYRQPTIFLMNSATLFHDAIRDIPAMIGEPVGQVSSKKIEWANFMVCMVATTKNRLKDPKFRKELSQYRVLIVDECDMAANKTNQKVMQNLYNCTVRVGLSGTVAMTKLKKDLIKNYTIEGYFGPKLYDITNRALIDLGISSEVAVKFVRGYKQKEEDETLGMGWMEDYTKYIVKNGRRNKKVLDRSIHHWKKGRQSQLIIAQRKDHIERLYKRFRKHYGPEVKIDWVHSERKGREKISEDFMDGEIDILIGSMILKRGKNFKKMNFMMNAGAGKSPENIIQLLGRAFRGCKFYEDMHDESYYLRKWTRAREVLYKREKIKVVNKYS